MIRNVLSCIFNERLSCCEQADVSVMGWGGDSCLCLGRWCLDARGEAVWVTVGASVVIETETPVPHYPDRTHSSHRL